MKAKLKPIGIVEKIIAIEILVKGLCELIIMYDEIGYAKALRESRNRLKHMKEIKLI
jgi:hypothetical protein